MSHDLFHLNRPVHLARRDVFFEHAAQLIHRMPSREHAGEQRHHAEKALFLFQEARWHAESANRSKETSRANRLFADLLDTAVDNTHSIARMLRRQLAVEAENSPLDEFLASRDTGSKMRSHYRRCAAHIHKGLQHILHQSEAPYTELKQASLSKMSADDKTRYQKARRHFEEQVHLVAEQAVGPLL